MPRSWRVIRAQATRGSAKRRVWRSVRSCATSARRSPLVTVIVTGAARPRPGRRQPDHHALRGVWTEHLREGVQVSFPADALDDPDALGRDAELVADRDSDARVAHVQGCDAHEEGINSRPAPGQIALQRLTSTRS